MRAKTSTSINLSQLEIAVKLMRAACHPLRMRILDYIEQHEAVHVNHIYSNLQLEQSITSQHLRILRQAGLVITQREGKYILYSVDPVMVDRVHRAVGNYLDLEQASMPNAKSDENQDIVI